MGSGKSKCKSPSLQPASSPLLRTYWRAIDWTTKDALHNDVISYKPEGASHVRILLYGPVRAGKSSFINSAGHAILGRNVNVAAGDATHADKSYTIKFQTHKFTLRGSTEPLPIVFNDLMGLEALENRGVRPEDIKLVMKGHVREGYMFHAGHALTEEYKYFNQDPTVDDKAHVLVCVLDGNAIEINSSVLQKMKEIREMARDLNIPQVAVVTHIDDVCGEIQKDIKNVYRSKALKKKMDQFSTAVGIPLHNVYAVWNNYEGGDKDAADILTLTAVRDMLHFGGDCIAGLR